MPEGPEVRRFADALNQVLSGKPIVSLLARTKTAKVWEKEHPGVLLNKRIERVLSHGKHLVGLIEGGYYFHSHLMMWGSWAVLNNPPQERDRRERSRIVVPDACAILYSAPIFDLGTGNPFEIVSNLRTLGTDILPYTVSDEARTRLQNDSSLVYTPGSEYGTRHYVFRRTNLPCLVCGSTIRQLRQVTQSDEEGEKTRIIYFCPTCQETNVELKKSKSKRKVVASNENIIEVQA